MSLRARSEHMRILAAILLGLSLMLVGCGGGGDKEGGGDGGDANLGSPTQILANV
jgi:hypothetical protein